LRINNAEVIPCHRVFERPDYLVGGKFTLAKPANAYRTLKRADYLDSGRDAKSHNDEACHYGQACQKITFVFHNNKSSQ
jgi:hypothetical protein